MHTLHSRAGPFGGRGGPIVGVYLWSAQNRPRLALLQLGPGAHQRSPGIPLPKTPISHTAASLLIHRPTPRPCLP